MKYLIVIEEAGTGFAAYAPDVPGCVATGATRTDVERAMEGAIKFHVEGLLSEQLDLPAAHSYALYMDVTA